MHVRTTGLSCVCCTCACYVENYDIVSSTFASSLTPRRQSRLAFQLYIYESLIKFKERITIDTHTEAPKRETFGIFLTTSMSVYLQHQEGTELVAGCTP